MRIRQVVFALCLAVMLLGANAYSQSYAVVNARIVTVSGATIDRGSVIIRDGIITAVGANAATPADAIVVDVGGATVYPGFIDALSSVGLAAPAPRPQGGGQAAAAAAAAAAQQAPTSNSNYPAGLRAEDMAVSELRAGEGQFEALRNGGFTTALTVGRSGIFNGQSVVINLAGDSVSSMVVKSPFAQHVSFVTLGFGTYPGSLMGTFSALRQMFYDAQRLREMQRAYAADPKGLRRPESDRTLEALYPLLDRQLPVVFNANREIEIIRALDLMKEFDLRGIIAGGQEAWKVADRLKAANVPVLLSLNFPKRTTASAPDADPETMEVLRFRAETPKGPSRLATAGVKFAFQTGNASVNDAYASAAAAVQNGLSRDAAIKAMTMDAAEILGISDRAGSIDVGKMANLTIVRGDVLGRDRFVSHVFVDGKHFEMREPARPAGGTGTGQPRPATGGGTRPPAPAPTPTPAAGINVSGTYTVTFDIPGQPIPATLTLVQSGETVTGTMSSAALGTSPLTGGRVTADGFTFSSSVMFQGISLDISVRGVLNGNQVTGSVDTPQGSIPFSGTKNP